MQIADSEIENLNVRYIKLGTRGSWTKRAFADGEIPLSFKELRHETALAGNEKEMAAEIRPFTGSEGRATTAARQVRDFYTLGKDTIWITFQDGKMWWARSDAAVDWIGDSESYAPRIRKTLGSWSSNDVNGVPLHIARLSSRLTKVAGTQNTICKVEDERYAIRKIFAIEEPVVKTAQAARETALSAILDLLDNLHWADFETLVDLLLARNGWNRVSELGGTVKDVDLEVEQTATKERGFVQVKSRADQREFDRYVEIFDANDLWSRMFFACHSPVGVIRNDRPEIAVWSRTELADLVFRQGLFDWLVARSG